MVCVFGLCFVMFGTFQKFGLFENCQNGSSWSSSARIGYLIMQFLGLSANLSSKQNMVWFLRTSKRKQQPFSWGADEAVA